MCEQLGIQNTVLLVLPPGGDSSAHAIVTNTIRSADKAAGFTAASTGKFAVRVRAHTGNGDLTVSVENVGTALHRSPPLRDDGMPHPLHVDCYFDACTYSYSGGVILDADGRAFDLQFAAEAGTAFAFRAQSRDAVKLKLTVYQQGAAQGADGFPAMVDAAMGSWYSTPPGHQSYAEHLLSIVLHSCQSCFGNQDKNGVEVTPSLLDTPSTRYSIDNTNPFGGAGMLSRLGVRTTIKSARTERCLSMPAIPSSLGASSTTMTSARSSRQHPVRNRFLRCHFILATIHLPRRARDKDRKR